MLKVGAIRKSISPWVSPVGAKPLYQLISADNAKAKKREIEWSDQCEKAFLELKEICSNMPVLAHADYQKPFKVHTDVSENGLEAVLYQEQDDGTTRVIAFASRSLSTLPNSNF